MAKKKKLGGARPGSGRPKGSLSPENKLRLKTEQAMKIRIMKNVNGLLNAQFTLAKGCTFLYRIDQNKKGKKEKPVLVTDPDEIRDYLDGEFGDGEPTNKNGSYYFMTTEKPNGIAIDSLVDRAYGRAPQQINLADQDGKPLYPALQPEQRERLKKRL